MAGNILSLEEAARRLGVTIDEINRLVDRKKLFPMRDGATVKFKLDDIERAASDLASDPASHLGSNLGDESSSGADDLALDLDLSSPSLVGGPGSPSGSGIADDDIMLGDAIDEGDSIFGINDAASPPSRTIIQEKGDQAKGDHAVGGEDLVIGDAGSALASSDLELDSIIGASSPSLARGAVGPASGLGSDVAAGGGSGTLAIDLSNLGSGSIAGLSGPAPGNALSGALDSGLSLEGSDLAASGLNLGGSGIELGGSGIEVGGSGVRLGDSALDLGGSPIGSGVDDIGGAFGGDAFELGDSTTDDESASVVISTEDTGDSSFFGAVTDDSGSVSLDDASSLSPVGMALGEEGFLEGVAGPPFSVLQIVGLVCCTLFLLTCSLVMIDLVWSIRAPVGEPISSPLLQALTDLFAWR
jgi:excisionase family DNA binding protein